MPVPALFPTHDPACAVPAPPRALSRRLYEAGADETVDLLGLQLATPQAGALFAAVGCTAVSLALLVQRQLFPIQ